jgi:hypothetical protein
MSLVRKQKLTEKNLAAKRTNARKSPGAVTPQGKAHSGAARLLHGLYSRHHDEVLTALGEDPKEYKLLLRTAMEDLRPTDGLGRELVSRMVRVLWRMRRTEHRQDGEAIMQVRAAMRKQGQKIGPQLVQIDGIYERLLALGRALAASDYVPSPEDVQAFETGFGSEPPAAVQILFPLLRSYREAAWKDPHPVGQDCFPKPDVGPTGESEKQATLNRLRLALDQTGLHYRRTLDLLIAESNSLRSPEDLAVLTAPQDANAWLSQRIEDSSVRQLWRLTRMFLSLKRQTAEAALDGERGKNDYIDENEDS